MFSPLIEQLISQLRYFPGVGPKSAQRMAFHLLARARPAGLSLAKTLAQAMEQVQYCKRCRTFTELPLCRLCIDPRRDAQLLCVVETPVDILAIEQTQAYKGYYFVLMGHLSPLEGIGPKELGIPDFLTHLEKFLPKEVILATGSTVEGEATAHYLGELLQPLNLSVSRIAHGIPSGNELEFIDSHTLMQALSARKRLHFEETHA
jgi:recombination protein RecR